MLDLRMSPFKKDLHWYLRSIEEVIIETLKEYDIHGVRDDINTGDELMMCFFFTKRLHYIYIFFEHEGGIPMLIFVFLFIECFTGVWVDQEKIALLAYHHLGGLRRMDWHSM
jgi:hypothetical protein